MKTSTSFGLNLIVQSRGKNVVAADQVTVTSVISTPESKKTRTAARRKPRVKESKTQQTRTNLPRPSSFSAKVSSRPTSLEGDNKRKSAKNSRPSPFSGGTVTLPKAGSVNISIANPTSGWVPYNEIGHKKVVIG